MKASKAVLFSTSACLIIIWAASFALSYVSLVDVALAGGLTYPWVWLFPLLLDAFMCIGSLDIIRRELNGEPTRNAWLLVIGVTAVSTCFNITRADPSALSWSVHALAPIVCFLSFEVEMGVLRSHFHQHQDNTDPTPTPTPVNPTTTTKATAKTSNRTRRETTPEMKTAIAEYFSQNPGANYSEAARITGISRHTIRGVMNRMSQPAAGEV